MILPTKYVPVEQSALGLAALLISLREQRGTVSQAWSAFVEARPNLSFDRFTEALTLLFLVGAVELDRGVLVWRQMT